MGAFLWDDRDQDSVIHDHSDHGRSNELMNPLWTRIHRFIWSIRATYYIFCCRNRNWDSPDLMQFWFSFLFFSFLLLLFFWIIQSQAAFVNCLYVARFTILYIQKHKESFQGSESKQRTRGSLQTLYWHSEVTHPSQDPGRS